MDVNLHSDAPIRKQDDDLLGREEIVHELALCVQNAPNERGFVIGLTGSWGSGKTSLLSLLESNLGESLPVIWFEPWLFSGTEELVSRFFSEVAGQVGQRGGSGLKDVAKALASYGEALAPVASALLGPLGNALGLPKKLFVEQESVFTQRQQLAEALSELGSPLIIFIDDLDRLEPENIREMMRLVRLVGDLPNLTYVLAYDQDVVEEGLRVSKIRDAAAYLEKIVQITVSVPPLSQEDVSALALAFLEEQVGEDSRVAWDSAVWTDLFEGGVKGYFSTVRDARRFANSAPIAIRICKDEVASMDVLALEAVRVFDRSAHAALPSLLSDLVPTAVAIARARKNGVDAAVAARFDEKLPESNTQTTRKILGKLFPEASESLGVGGPAIEPEHPRQSRRVRSAPVFYRYLHHRLPHGEASVQVVKEVVAALPYPNDLAVQLAQIDSRYLQNVLSRIDPGVQDSEIPDLAATCVEFVKVVERIEESKGIFQMTSSFSVSSVIGRLLDATNDLEVKQRAVLASIEAAPTLEVKMDFWVLWTGTRGRTSTGQPLIGDATRKTLESEISELILESDLSKQRRIGPIVLMLTSYVGKEKALEKVRKDEVLRALVETTRNFFAPEGSAESGYDLNQIVQLLGREVIPDLQEIARDDSEGVEDPAEFHQALNKLVDDSQPA